MSFFDDFVWDGRKENETYEEFKNRKRIQNGNIKYYLRGRRLKDGEKGTQRRRYLQKKRERGLKKLTSQAQELDMGY